MNNKLFLSIILIIFLFICCQNVFATERPLEIDYPEIAGEKPTTVQETLLPDFIKYLFNFSLIVVGLIAFAALIIGGFLYLISAGNPAALSDAKDRMLGALIGLVLLLCSWLILNTINPQLTIFYPIELPEVSFYQGTTGTVTLFEDDCDGFTDCDDDNPCTAEGTKCFDIFKDGSKKCVDETKMVNLAVKNNLKYQIDESEENWDDRASSLILYGENKRVRACADPDIEECKILTEPNVCIDISELRDDIPGKGDILGKKGEGRLSSLKVMNTPQGARLYEEKNFGGAYQEFPYRPDHICSTDLSIVGDNYASSIEVGPGYWTVLCREKNGDCGFGCQSIIYDIFNESIDSTPINDATGYGDADLSNNYAGDSVSKICVIKFDTCGGVLIYGEGETDFIEKRGEKHILGSEDSMVNNNAIEKLYQYGEHCKVKIYEKSGTGSQGDVLNSVETCTGPKICCGREWISKTFNGELILSDEEPDIKKDVKYSCYHEGDNCIDTNCTEYKYTFCSNDTNCFDCAENECCPQYSEENDPPEEIYYSEYCTNVTTENNEDEDYCNSCERCNEINRIFKRASCIQVIE